MATITLIQGYPYNRQTQKKRVQTGSAEHINGLALMIKTGMITLADVGRRYNNDMQLTVYIALKQIDSSPAKWTRRVR